MVEEYALGKVARWTLLSAIPIYFCLQTEVFVKPTSTKAIIQAFDLTNLKYSPKPSWDFYQAYRDVVLGLKAHADKRLKPNNLAFNGFLMMSLC